MLYHSTTYRSPAGEHQTIPPPHSHNFALAVADIIERAQAQGMAAAEVNPEWGLRAVRTGRVADVVGEMVITNRYDGVLADDQIRNDFVRLRYLANENCDPRMPAEASVDRDVEYGSGVRLGRRIQTGPGYLTDRRWAIYSGRRHDISLWTVVGPQIDDAVSMVQAGVPNVDRLPVPIIESVVCGLDNPRLHNAARERLQSWGAALIAQQPPG
jgi:hypothetical protein